VNNLCISVYWLDDRYHGQNANGAPEWPPSPLRLFQAMLAGLCHQVPDAAALLGPLRWMESNLHHLPYIVAPHSQPGRTFTRFVPNNDSDRKFDRQERLTAKPVCPTLLLDPPTIHYVWRLDEPLSDADRVPMEPLASIARNIVAFGWGVDMAVGSAAIISDEQANALPGERWFPHASDSDRGLRVPIPGTLDDVLNRHKQFLTRLSPGGYVAPPPLSVCEKVPYRRATDPPIRPIAVFSLLKLDASGFRAFDTCSRGLTVAGMIKFAAKAAAEPGGWPDKSFVLGHGEANGAKHIAVGPKRFAYLPLPSIEERGAGTARVVGGIRRAIVTTFAEDCEKEIAWARRSLSGQELIDEDKKEPIALLSLIPTKEKVVQCYAQSAATWATVTPVVLPGYDDPAHYRRRIKRGISGGEQGKLLEHLDDRIEGLLRKAILQAGFSQTLADHAELEWRKTGFWPGTELADRYGIPDHLKRVPRYHVKIHWRDEQKRPVEIPGPVCIGGGRFYGLGLFAAW
jgi:CRISPR-associated protein Csb2